MGWKLKVFPACLALIVLACSVHAEITIVSPYEATIPQGANFNLGSAQPGETVKIIISSSSGVSGLPWTSAELTAVPPGWKTGAISQGGKTLLLTAEIPKDARQNAYNLSILLSNTRGEPAAEEFSARLFVENGLLRTSVTQQKTSTLVNEAVPYTITLNNSSIAPHRVLVTSTLSEQWFPSTEFIVGAKETMEQTVYLTPRIYGTANFRIETSSLMNGENFSGTNSRLYVLPTLKGKYSPLLYGFPIFTPSLLPYYAIDSAISYIFP